MHANRFDTITRLFAKRRLNRRQALATGAASLTAGVLTANQAFAQEASPATTPVATDGGYEKTMYLFVQSFQSGSIAPTAGQDGRYTVTLDHGLGQTIYFADRPSREVGVSPTQTFLKSLGFPEDNPPNAALLVETESGETDIAVVELYNPTYDETTHTATYEVAVLDSWQDDLELGLQDAPADLAALAPEFSTAHLLIDDCADATVNCFTHSDGGTWIGSFDWQPFCYNYLICMPCEPYGSSQPDKCSTIAHWAGKCDETFGRCADEGCYADFAGAIFMGC